MQLRANLYRGNQGGQISCQAILNKEVNKQRKESHNASYAYRVVHVTGSPVIPKPNSIEPILRLRFIRNNLPLLLTRFSASFIVLSNCSIRRILLKRSLAVLTY